MLHDILPAVCPTIAETKQVKQPLAKSNNQQPEIIADTDVEIIHQIISVSLSMRLSVNYFAAKLRWDPGTGPCKIKLSLVTDLPCI